MTREGLVQALTDMVERIGAAEEAALEAEWAVAQQEAALEACEDQLLLSGQIDGKNDAVRQAQLRAGTASHRAQLAALEEMAERAKVVLRAVRAELSCLRSLARLLGDRGQDVGERGGE